MNFATRGRRAQIEDHDGPQPVAQHIASQLAPPLLSMRFCAIYRKRGHSKMKLKTLGAYSMSSAI